MQSMVCDGRKEMPAGVARDTMEHPLRAYEYDTDKHQLYLNNYVRHFQHLAHQHIKLLELGVLNGGSLLLWRDYFQDGQIVGLHLNRVNIDDRTGRIRVYQGDQRDLQLLTRIAGECSPDGFDIIIDDASHIAEFTKISFWHLFENHLNPGGYYVIEDWRVGYSELWPDGAVRICAWQSSTAQICPMPIWMRSEV
jgi:hypothetical protein